MFAKRTRVGDGQVTDDPRRNTALFPIGIVMKLTDLTARQVRYYEQHRLITPVRTSGNQRLFSFNDVERLLEIKALIEKGVNVAGVKQMMSATPQETESSRELLPTQADSKRKELSEKQLHALLKQQLLSGQGKGKVSLIQGELSRFFNNKPKK